MVPAKDSQMAAKQRYQKDQVAAAKPHIKEMVTPTKELEVSVHWYFVIQ